MEKVFNFGENVKGFDIKVLNEREVRAGSGILFLFAIIAFMNSWLTGNFYFTKLFVLIFLVDFAIRIFINPKYSPSLILGRFFTRNQKPEYVGASQKRFAWSMGFLFGIAMFFVLVLNDVIGLFNLFACLIYLILLFSESVFGICLGCNIYNLLNKEQAKLCPGGVCDRHKKEEIQEINIAQISTLVVFFVFIFFLPSFNFIKQQNNSIKYSQSETTEKLTSLNNDEDNPCVVPNWAKSIGHEEKYKLHNGCKE